MDLEWLLPEQIDQILRFCELSAVEDLTLAANILENHEWDIEVTFYLFRKPCTMLLIRTIRWKKKMP